MTTDELKKYCDEEFANIDLVKKELFSIYNAEKTEYRIHEQAAVAVFIANIYSGMEKILKQMLIYDRLDIEDAPGWHEKVLKKANEIGILPPDLYQILTRYLTFRNFFVYTYIFNMKWEDLKVMTDAIDDLVTRFRNEVNEYIQTI